MPRLRRTSPDQPGWTRRRAGKGFVYLDQAGDRLPPEDAQRVRDLVIPPAWKEVWVTPYENGHLQAVGTDDAGRRQYLYHPVWRAKRDAEKFDRMQEFGRALVKARELVLTDLG
ncbi:MAG: Eukaryotic topoisomerase catalytic core, partial [Nocardioides sp.]|nr:Eukaryotic topoisomerase catalytic core [Nocardioides sp.]